MALKKSSCFGCEDRTSECHAKCPRYAEFTKNRNETLLLQMAKMTKGGLSVDMMLDVLKEVYIPAMIVEMAGDTVVREEVIDPE